MKTVGEVLKEARNKKRCSLDKLEKETKIKSTFIQAIEKGDWENLPEFPVVLGFVKNIASFLDMDPKNAIALLRRDYPPKVLTVNPKPDVTKRFIWSPKLTFIVGCVIAVLLITAYLGFQYLKFISPPDLQVSYPEESQVIDEPLVKVEGKTDSEATVKVNNQPVLVGEDGNFSAELEISENTNEIIVVAEARSGKISQVVRKIVPKFD
jgi:cytoskeletal protein RodZ